MNDIVLIGDRFLTSLFKFAGVDTIEEPNDELAAKEICDLVADEQYKIIMITENVAFKLTELRNNLLATHRLYPIFVIVPGLEQTFGERENQLKQLVSQSLGIKLKFGE
jgi:vacuolar-type H+-ATPase subunit F/Vma7